MTRLSIVITWFVVALASATVRAEDLTRKEVQTAKRLYDSKCARCHRVYDPRDYAEDEWRLWMTKMSKKARLKPTQEKLLNRYLDAYRTEKPAAKSSSATPGEAASATPPSKPGSAP